MGENRDIYAFSIDANILIDYLETDGEILSLVSKYLAPIYLADIVAAEVNQFQKINPDTLGITVIETPYTVLSESSDRQVSISIQDFVCMRIAEQRDWACATNDGALRRECKNRGVPVVRGLTLMSLLTRKGILDIDRAKRCAWAIHSCNKMISERIVQSFIEELIGE